MTSQHPLWIVQASLSSPGAACTALPPAQAPGIGTLLPEPAVLPGWLVVMMAPSELGCQLNEIVNSKMIDVCCLF